MSMSTIKFKTLQTMHGVPWGIAEGGTKEGFTVLAAFFSFRYLLCSFSVLLVLLKDVTVKFRCLNTEFILSPHMCSVETVPLVVIRFFFFFRLHHAAFRSLVPRPGMNPCPCTGNAGS